MIKRDGQIPWSDIGQSGSRQSPTVREDLSLFQNGLSCFLLHVGGIAIFSEDTFDEHTEMGANIFPQRPV